MSPDPDRRPPGPPTADPSDLDDGALADQIADLADLRDGTEARDAVLLRSLRAWSKRSFGNVEWLAVEVARETGLSFGHVRNALYGQVGSDDAIDTAVRLFRERAAPAQAA